MKKFLPFLLLIIIVIAGIALAWNLTSPSPSPISPLSPKACTLEAKLCPDGSAVGRTGPNCEFAKCPSDNQEKGVGYISGHVTIGPFCPVERADQPCKGPPEAYTSREAIAYGSDMVTVKARTHLSAEGNYTLTLPPGKYYVQIAPAGIGEGEKKPAIVKAGATTTVNFDIDTGIR